MFERSFSNHVTQLGSVEYGTLQTGRTNMKNEAIAITVVTNYLYVVKMLIHFNLFCMLRP